MDILKRISELREERGWTEYELAQRSGIPQSTISSWYRKNMLPSISSLEKIAAAYHYSLSQFFLEGDDAIISFDTEKELLHEWKRLDDDQQEKLLSFLKSL